LDGKEWFVPDFRTVFHDQDPKRVSFMDVQEVKRNGWLLCGEKEGEGRMADGSFDITPIARELNDRAQLHPIGQLQTIRTELHGFSRRPGSDIFSAQTIHRHWAFHHGGRKELQFNIGLEDITGENEIRHGVGFSFEPSQALPDIEVLIPKAHLFSDYMRLYPDHYADVRMWHHQHGERSNDYPPGPVMPELVVPGTFVFLGKRQPIGSIDYEAILTDFDLLLPLYRYVESGGREEIEPAAAAPRGFAFRAGCNERPATTTATLAERELNVSLRHNLLQGVLTRRLIAQFGAANVADEHPSGLGTKIDVVLRCGRSEFWYYEIKTAISPRACLREALGQVMEYAYWPGAQEPARLIVCGESPLDHDGAAYLERLNERFRLPIAYEQIVLES
jgi:hypothetical protein